MSIYLAGPLECIDEVRSLATRLFGLGHIIVSNWHDTRATRERERELSAYTRSVIASENFRRIDTANVVVMLADTRARGTLVEVGYAIGRGTPVIVYAPRIETRRADLTLMLAYGTVEVTTWEDLLDAIASH